MENKPKQTAVDYLFARMEVLRGLFLFEEIDYKEYVDEKKHSYIKAKEMEKQQIVKAVNDYSFYGSKEIQAVLKKYNLKTAGEKYYHEHYEG